MRTDFSAMQQAIKQTTADAWVLYDFRKTNDLAWDMLGLSEDAHCTRRWLVIIPAKGRMKKLVHKMERVPLEHVEAEEFVYATKEEYEEKLREILAPFKKIAMEYSPMNAIPVVSKVDAGTIEMIRSFGHEVISSGDLTQRYTAVLSKEQMAGVEVTAGVVRDVITEGFRMIRDRLIANERVTEYEVQQFLLSEFKRNRLQTDDPPLVAIGVNAANPHYAPTVTRSSVIEHDNVVVIDAWARNVSGGSVYADLTWVGYTGSSVPSDVERTFQVIVKARDAALALVAERFASGEPVHGYEVDRAARSIVNAAGLGSHFIHRTGHSITTQLHGPGVNMDDYESHDTRQLLAGMSFSIEPGVYFDNSLGLRTEIGVNVRHDGTVAVPSAPLQTHILPILSDDWE